MIASMFQRLSLSTLKLPPLTQKRLISTLEPPPLPGLPPPVQGWPTFWIARKEVEEYLYPLYDRGWGVHFLARKNHAGLNDRYVAHLNTDYTFANYNCASQFITDMGPVCENEKHHPTQFILNNHTKRPTLSLLLNTHSAFRPRWNEEPTYELSRRVPGLTRRDIRTAILLDQLYDGYYHSGRALIPRGSSSYIQRLWNRPKWEYLVSRFVRSSLSLRPMTKKEERDENERLLDLLEKGDGSRKEKNASSIEAKEEEEIACQACGGPHKIQDCADRALYPPSTLCYLCLEPHWWLDCPSRQNS